MKPYSVLASLLATSGLALATTTFQFEFGYLRDDAQATLADGIYLLLADSDGDAQFPTATELLGATLGTGQTIGGDYVFHAGNISSGLASDTTAAINYTTAGVASGDRWAIYWFPNATLNNPALAGTSYGAYHNSLVDSSTDLGGNVAMLFPSDNGNLVTTIYYEPNALSDITGNPPTGNTPSVLAFSATGTVVPEPSSAALGLIGLAGACLVRRRRD